MSVGRTDQRQDGRAVCRLFLRPEDSFDAEFALRLNDTTDIVTEKFAKHFVLHGRVRLAADGIPELALGHAEGRLDIAPLVVMPQEFIPPELVVEEHALPERAGFALLAVDLERDERRPA